LCDNGVIQPNTTSFNVLPNQVWHFGGFVDQSC
jgi:hypothetical protein